MRRAIVLIAAWLLLPSGEAALGASPRPPTEAAPAVTSTPSDDALIHLPASARPTYFGIHGGTVPVSLLIADDGAALVGFVGRTGDDFLSMLRRAGEASPPSEPDDAPLTPFAVLPPVRPLNEAVVRAGRGGLPVFHSRNGAAGRLLPFGFSEKPLVIEGDAVLPGRTSPVRRHLFFEARHLRPQQGS